jgi:hypothetical protein
LFTGELRFDRGFSIRRASRWRLPRPERLDGVEQKEVNAALCGSLCNMDGVRRPICVVAVVDSDTVIRDAFHSG